MEVLLYLPWFQSKMDLTPLLQVTTLYFTLESRNSNMLLPRRHHRIQPRVPALCRYSRRFLHVLRNKPHTIPRPMSPERPLPQFVCDVWILWWFDWWTVLAWVVLTGHREVCVCVNSDITTLRGDIKANICSFESSFSKLRLRQDVASLCGWELRLLGTIASKKIPTWSYSH